MPMTKPTSEQVTFLAAGSGASQRTVLDKLRDVVSVKDFGAVGDGVTDDTAAIENVLNTAASSALFPAATGYAGTAIQITTTATNKVWTFCAPLTFSGATAGIELAVNLSGLQIDNFAAVGDGVVGNLNRALWTSGSYTLTNILVNNPRISNMVQGLDFGGMSNVTVTGGSISGSVGTGAGQGYGIVAGNGASNVTFNGITFTNNARHALYLGNTTGASVMGCHFNNHSNGTTTSNAALSISRGNGYSIAACTFKSNYGPSISIDDDSAVSGILTTTAVSGNAFFDQIHSSEILVGPNAAPTANIGVACINVTANSINRSSVNTAAGVTVRSCRELVISGNSMYLPNSLYAISHINDAGATATAITKFVVSNNVGDLSSGGYPVYLDTALCGGTAEVIVRNNSFANATDGRPIKYQTDPPTNPNIKHDGDFYFPVTLVSGSQTMNIAGYNNFVITGDASGSTISNFTNPYQGKTITLRFQDSNVTITRANAYLSGGVNFTSSQYDVLVLQYIGSSWFEVSRSVNN
jgi:hypothetical protein